MNRVALAQASGPEAAGLVADAALNGQSLVLHAFGALYIPSVQALVVSDLHLEKGAAFARRGQLLPPWDTFATLSILTRLVEVFDPALLISLGDNFHDRQGSALMPEEFRAMILALAKGRDLVWINGNHDPDGVTDLPGTNCDELAMSGLTFRHEPARQPAPGEISGHLHPAATVIRRDRAVRRPCFAMDASRLIMPSFGVMTGGLDLRHQAFRGLFDKPSLVAHLLGRDRVFSVPFGSLRG